MLLSPRISKAERLKSRKLINSLFSSGHSFVEHPIRVVWATAQTPTPSPIQVGVTVSPRKFPRAVQRNRIKRLLREAYRLNKKNLMPFFEGKQKGLVMMLLYISNREVTYQEIEEKIIASFQRLNQEHEHPEQDH